MLFLPHETSEEYAEEEKEDGDDIQGTDMITLICFEIIELIARRIYYPQLIIL